MKKMLAVMVAMSLMLVVGMAVVYAADKPAEDAPGKVLRHVVLFKFKADATQDQIHGVEKAFAALKDKISVVQDFEWGTDVSPENLQQGFTHCFLATFKSEADRDTYLQHPDHKEFGKLLGPCLDKVLVVDFWARK